MRGGAGADPADGASRRGLRDLLTQPGYRRLWTARTVSQWGDTFNFVALALLIHDLTRSGLGVSGVVVAKIVPVLLFAPLAGPLADRWPRVRVMVCSDLFRVVLAVVLAVWHDAPAGVYLIAFGMSVGAVFFNPAASSLLPALVRDDELVADKSGIWTAAVPSQIVLAPLAGFLAISVGYGPAFALNAASYALSALVLRGLHVPANPHSLPRRRLLAEAREGVGVLLCHRLLRTLAVGQLLAALFRGRDQLAAGGPGRGAPRRHWQRLQLAHRGHRHQRSARAPGDAEVHPGPAPPAVRLRTVSPCVASSTWCWPASPRSR